MLFSAMMNEVVMNNLFSDGVKQSFCIEINSMKNYYIEINSMKINVF